MSAAGTEHRREVVAMRRLGAYENGRGTSGGVWRRVRCHEPVRRYDNHLLALVMLPIRRDDPLTIAEAARKFPDAAAAIVAAELVDLRPSAIRRFVEASFAAAMARQESKPMTTTPTIHHAPNRERDLDLIERERPEFHRDASARSDAFVAGLASEIRKTMVREGRDPDAEQPHDDADVVEPRFDELERVRARQANMIEKYGNRAALPNRVLADADGDRE